MNPLINSTNAEYHADREYLSSSQLKLLLADPARFYHEIILGNASNEQKSAYEVGTLLHTMILEPHLLTETAVYPGMTRRGKAFEEFKAANEGKKIVTANQMVAAERMYKAYCALPAAVALISGGMPEHTMTAEIQGVKTKCRADYINIDAGYIVDAKSTAMPSGLEIFRNTVSEYDYDLSASLYCRIAEQVYKKKFDFYWLTLSKADDQAHVYKQGAASRGSGAEKVAFALTLYKQCKETGIWQLPEKAGSVRALITDYEILEV